MNIRSLINEATVNDILISQTKGALTENQLKEIINTHTSNILEQYKVDLNTQVQTVSSCYEISSEQIKVGKQIKNPKDKEIYQDGYNTAIKYAKEKMDYLVNNITLLKPDSWKKEY